MTLLTPQILDRYFTYRSPDRVLGGGRLEKTPRQRRKMECVLCVSYVWADAETQGCDDEGHGGRRLFWGVTLDVGVSATIPAAFRWFRKNISVDIRWGQLEIHHRWPMATPGGFRVHWCQLVRPFQPLRETGFCSGLLRENRQAVSSVCSQHLTHGSFHPPRSQASVCHAACQHPGRLGMRSLDPPWCHLVPLLWLSFWKTSP